MPPDDVDPMRMANMPFMLSKVAEECPPLQFIRELTQNGLEALESHLDGVVTWTFDRWYLDNLGVRKLAVVDSGVGMSAEDLVRYIRDFASSGHEQGSSGNFGVGAKLSAAHFSPRGLLYRSWQHGVGHKILLRTSGPVPGLVRWPDGGTVATVDNGEMPEEVRRAGGHGTMVTLLGNDDTDDTASVRPGVEGGNRWVGQALGRRYFDFPAGRTVKAIELRAEGSEQAYKWPEIAGARTYLETRTAPETRGTVEVSDARIWWWLLAPKAGGSYDRLYRSQGHAAVIHSGELLNVKVGPAGRAALIDFGLPVGYDRVVIYVEPLTDAYRMNLARTAVLHAGNDLPWERWATEFNTAMPEALRAHVEESARVGTADGVDLQSHLTKVFAELGIGRYRRTPEGPTHVATDDTGPGGGATGEDSAGDHAGGTPGGEGATRGNGDGMEEAPDGDTAKKLPYGLTPPTIRWRGTGEGRLPLTELDEDLEDRAALYVPGLHELHVNCDFRGYRTLLDLLSREFGEQPGARALIRGTLDGEYAKLLAEAVIAVLAAARGDSWEPEQKRTAYSPEALTAVALTRSRILEACRKTLRPLKAAA